jgi:Signal transduction histidine kinase
LILFGRNVTQIIQLEKDSLENQCKSGLLRTVSHELRTPINAVVAMTEAIKETKDISSENKERLDIIAGSCTYQLYLINDLLDFAQIIAGCLKISQIPFNINNLLVECLRLIKIQLQGYDIKVELKTFNLPEIITSDPYRIKQIILNLLSNAKKLHKTRSDNIRSKTFRTVFNNKVYRYRNRNT